MGPDEAGVAVSQWRMRVRRTAMATAGALAVLPAAAVPAGAAATGHDGASVRTFASGFASDARGIGPVGLAFGDGRRLYVTDQHLYRFGPDGGSAADSRLTAQPLSASATGLAFGTDGRLYAGRYTGPRRGEIVELDPGSGDVVRTVAADLPCPTALATDPATGDLFVSTVDCGHGVLRISGPAGAGAAVSPYVENLNVDGMMFAPDGSLFVAHDPDRDGRTISIVDGTQSATPGARTPIASVPHTRSSTPGAR